MRDVRRLCPYKNSIVEFELDLNVWSWKEHIKQNQPRSCSFTNQTLAQLELWKERDSGKYKTDQVYLLPKNLDEKVARLHLPALGAELTVLTKEQADYIDVPVGGPYKPDTYRY